MSTHYVRYHKQEPGNEIRSEPGRFEAWAERRPSPGKGDIIWVLSGRPMPRSDTSYRLEHYFKAQAKAELEGDRWVIRGTEGQVFENRPDIGNNSWFKKFFDTIGRGGTSIQKIPHEHLEYFRLLMSEALKEDILDDAIEEAEKTKCDDEIIMLRAIKTRRGQAAFREALFDAYEARCCFTGCKVADVLGAAHISSHSEETNYQISNGLLLRTDIHTLFDLHLIAVDQWNKIRVSKRLKDSEYQKLDGKVIELPSKLADHPSRYNLARRLEKLKLQDTKIA